MPWLSHAGYTKLIRENERANAHLAELEQLRANLAHVCEALNKERDRNREREERLLDRVLVSKGVYAVTSPAEKKAKASPSAAPLTAYEEATLKMYITSAEENGFGPNVGRRMFERDRKIKLNPNADLSEFADLPVITAPDEIVDDFSGVTEAE